MLITVVLVAALALLAFWPRRSAASPAPAPTWSLLTVSGIPVTASRAPGAGSAVSLWVPGAVGDAHDEDEPALAWTGQDAPVIRTLPGSSVDLAPTRLRITLPGVLESGVLRRSWELALNLRSQTYATSCGAPEAPG